MNLDCIAHSRCCLVVYCTPSWFGIYCISTAQTSKSLSALRLSVHPQAGAPAIQDTDESCISVRLLLIAPPAGPPRLYTFLGCVGLPEGLDSSGIASHLLCVCLLLLLPRVEELIARGIYDDNYE